MITRYIIIFGVAAMIFLAKNVMAKTKTIAEHLETTRSELQPLDFKSKPEYSESTKEYFKYYSIDIKSTKHIFGTFKSGSDVLAANIYLPAKSKGTVIIAHGYYDHAGVWKHVITNLVDKGYNVAIYDQPGHGLSTGDRATIGDFSEYFKSYRIFVEICRKNLKGPYFHISHSTGSASVIDYVLKSKGKAPDKIIMIAPLVRSAMWALSGFGTSISEQFADSVPRVFRKNSSDKEFLKFMKNDPLQADAVPADWINAHRKWESLTKKYKPSQLPILIIQGEKDTTVDWKYNVKFLEDKFPKAKTELIKKGGHQLINESPVMRNKVLKMITDYLEGSS